MARKALVVDDSKAARFMIGKIVRDLGFETIDACDGRDALLRLEENVDLEVALVDWNMPEMNGLELVQAMRCRPEFDAIKILMVTTETEMMQVVRAIEAGANEYVMKPFTKDVLVDKLKLVGIE